MRFILSGLIAVMTMPVAAQTTDTSDQSAAPLLVCAGYSEMLNFVIADFPIAIFDDAEERAARAAELRMAFSVAHDEDMNCETGQAEIEATVFDLADLSFDEFRRRVGDREDITDVAEDYWSRIDACVASFGEARLQEIATAIEDGETQCGWP